MPVGEWGGCKACLDAVPHSLQCIRRGMALGCWWGLRGPNLPLHPQPWGHLPSFALALCPTQQHCNWNTQEEEGTESSDLRGAQGCSGDQS